MPPSPPRGQGATVSQPDSATASYPHCSGGVPLCPTPLTARAATGQRPGPRRPARPGASSLPPRRGGSTCVCLSLVPARSRSRPLSSLPGEATSLRTWRPGLEHVGRACRPDATLLPLSSPAILQTSPTPTLTRDLIPEVCAHAPHARRRLCDLRFGSSRSRVLPLGSIIITFA